MYQVEGYAFVTIDNGTTSETITLSTIVEGMYCK